MQKTPTFDFFFYIHQMIKLVGGANYHARLV